MIRKYKVICVWCTFLICMSLVISNTSFVSLAEDESAEDNVNETSFDASDMLMPEIKDSSEQDFSFKNIGDIEAEAAIVVDVKTGYTLYEKNIYKKMYPASITKTMTCLLSIENLDLKDDITFSYDAVYGIEAGSSSAYMSEGETITVEQALYGLMLISGNDLANGLAEAVSGTQSKFAELMTAKAKQLGCKNTNFMNPHGLHDENHYTCPYDMALMAKYAYDNMPFYRTLISTLHYTLEPTSYYPETRYWTNNNKLINEEETEFYDENCLGGKTGFTDEARNTLVSFHEVNGRVLLIVVMKCPGYQYAYGDTTKLCKYAEENISGSFWNEMDEKYEKENAKQVSNTKVNSTQSLVASSKAVKTDKDESKSSIIHMILIVSFICAIALVVYDLYTTAKKRGIIDRRRRRNRRRKYRRG